MGMAPADQVGHNGERITLTSQIPEGGRLAHNEGIFFPDPIPRPGAERRTKQKRESIEHSIGGPGCARTGTPFPKCLEGTAPKKDRSAPLRAPAVDHGEARRGGGWGMPRRAGDSEARAGGGWVGRTRRDGAAGGAGTQGWGVGKGAYRCRDARGNRQRRVGGWEDKAPRTRGSRWLASSGAPPPRRARRGPFAGAESRSSRGWPCAGYPQNRAPLWGCPSSPAAVARAPARRLPRLPSPRGSRRPSPPLAPAQPRRRRPGEEAPEGVPRAQRAAAKAPLARAGHAVPFGRPDPGTPTKAHRGGVRWSAPS